ncbi:hypothetical protein [Stappia indica]|uniref:hypothetical protein n=1 Tax=Stappia indica TaxID=538381 RepID=UPI001146C848|nr:hypothetical protein [Stappia indica]
MPEIARVCDEGEGGSIRFRKRRLRLSHRCSLFAQRGLVFVQLAQARFIGFRERAGAGPHHPVDQLTHLHLDALQLAGNGTGHLLAAGKTVVPLIAQHLVDRVEEMRARLERGQQRLELALDDLLAH